MLCRWKSHMFFDCSSHLKKKLFVHDTYSYQWKVKKSTQFLKFKISQKLFNVTYLPVEKKFKPHAKLYSKKIFNNNTSYLLYFWVEEQMTYKHDKIEEKFLNYNFIVMKHIQLWK